MMKTYYKKYLKVFSTMLLGLLVIQSEAQFSYEYLGDGKYEYSSSYPDAHLHFYLFGDGYHSFDANVLHDFSTTNAPADVQVFHAKPYETDEVDEYGVGGGDNGTPTPDVDIVSLGNQVELKTSWNPVNQQDDYYILMFENNYSDVPLSGCVEFHFSTEELFVEEDLILDEYNSWVSNREYLTSDYTADGYTHKFKWSFTNLQKNEQRFIYVEGNCLLQALKTVNTLAVMKTDCSVVPPLNGDPSGPAGNSQVFELDSRVSSFPHDPNCIIPQCITPTQLSDDSNYDGVSIEYRIYFQNIAADPAQHVYIDTELLPIAENVHLLDASHQCDFSYNYINGMIDIDFWEINLPGILGLGDDDGDLIHTTIGWVDLLVCFGPGVIQDYYDDNMCIKHTGIIEFYNAAPLGISDSYCHHQWQYCMQNYGEESSGLCTSELDGTINNLPTGGTRFRERMEDDVLDISIQPNPVSENFLMVKLNAVSSGEASITVFSVDGATQEIAITNQTESEVILDLGKLNQGFYYIQVTRNGTTKLEPFVKM